MLSSKIIIALCDTDEEVDKFVHCNRNNSLIPYMKDFCLGFNHLCGTPKDDGMYLITSVSLNGITPDVLFEREYKAHGRTYSDRMYGYLMEDLPRPLLGNHK
jgi:hypothetical protein